MKNVRVISFSSEQFIDRQQAGLLLAKALEKFRAKTVVVLGIPRGGIIVAAEIARFLNSELDIILSRKLGAPGNPELAVGALSENGDLYVNEELALRVNADKDYLEKEKLRQLSVISRRSSFYRSIFPKVALKGKIAVITDDGVATGATIQAALWSARREKAKKVIAAVPVASKESLHELARHADRVIVYRLPELFYAVGQFYQDFPQVSDDEVITVLKQYLEQKKIRGQN